MQIDEAPGYIRGGAGVVDTRRLFRVLLGCAIVTLAVFVVVLTIQAVQRNTRIDHLRHRGVPVDVTVTSCLGILSGTGVTVTSFQCNGSFELAGHSYNAVIGGSSINHAPGDVVHAVADPKHPTSLSTTGSLVNAHSSWRAFIGAAILFLSLVLLIGWAVWWSRRKSTQRGGADATRGVLPMGDLNHPTSTAATGSAVSIDSSPRASIAPVVMVLALLLVVAGGLWWLRRDSAQRSPDGDRWAE